MKSEDDQISYILRMMIEELINETFIPTMRGSASFKLYGLPTKSKYTTLKNKEALSQNSEENQMTPKNYLAMTKNRVSGYSPLAIFREGKEDCLFLMRDDNNICYVTNADMAYSMMYNMVLTSGELCCQVADSPMSRQLPTLMEIAEVRPWSLTSIFLTQEQMEWLRNPSISDMVKSVQSAME